MPLHRCFVVALTALVTAGCPAVEGEDPTPSPQQDAGDTTDDADFDNDEESTPADIVFAGDRFVVEEGSVREPEAGVVDAAGEPIEEATVEWTSADPEVIEISSAGLAVGQQIGDTELTATAGDIERGWPAEVVGARAAEVTVVPEETTLLVDAQLPYDVALRDSSNAPIDEDRPVEWSTTDAEVATIDNNGVVTGVGAGQTEVVGIVDGVEDRADLTVTEADVESLAISPVSPAPIAYGDELKLEATAYDVEGNELAADSAQWSSSAPDVASVDTTGLVEALAAGETTISATLDDAADEVDLEVYFLVQQIDSGQGFSCAVAVEQLFCVGTNDTGQLADGSFDAGTELTSADYDGDVDDIALGDDHGCLLDGGDVYCWGDNDAGQVDPGLDDDQSVPVLVYDGSVSALSAGPTHSCLVDDGDVHCWGDNDRRQLGSNDTTDQGPVQTDGPVDFVDVAVGDDHTCAIGADEAGYCWGDNTRGQIGGIFEGDLTAEPETLDGGHDELASISAGDDHTCATQYGSPPVCWGANDRGQLGEGGTEDEDVPLTLSLDDGESLSALEAGARHSCGLAGGELRCWGAADDDRLAIDTGDDATTPQPAGGDNQFGALSVGNAHGCGVTPDDEVLCWGAEPGNGFEPQEIDFEL